MRGVFLGTWGVDIDNDELRAFVSRHGLARRLGAHLPIVDGNALVAPAGYQRSYFPSIFGDFLRQLWMAREESFTFETVMSHPDRVEALEDARSRGALAASSRAYLFDNSGPEHRLVAEYEAGKLTRRVEDLPRWFPRS